MSRIVFCCALIGLPVLAEAQSYVVKSQDNEVIFRSDEDIVIVRGVLTLQDAVFELIFEDGGGRIQCFAHSADGTPVASTHANMTYGYVSFAAMEIDQIAGVACRWRE
ncbi:hypothetical protein [Thalassococcus profundi]|uniref:hypothetical protein n=1 Tax=Thalassococcus profundi TaxID=2282382 RepID=UPI0011C018E4|nr:hypothetical protein [Thalassococcus profundi]